MKKVALLSAVTFSIIMATVVQGADLDQVKARMKNRRPVVVALLTQQKAGENNQGYLVIRGEASADEKKALNEENADRKQVYEEIAVKTKATIQIVGAQRASAIAGLAQSGAWLQNASGQWYQKK